MRLSRQTANASSYSILLGPKKFHKGIVIAFEPVVVVKLANPTLKRYSMQESILNLLLLQLKHGSRAPNVMVGSSIDRFLDPPSLAPCLLNLTQAHAQFELTEGVRWIHGNRIPITEYHVLPKLPSFEETISANIRHQMHICHRKLWTIGLVPPAKRIDRGITENILRPCQRAARKRIPTRISVATRGIIVRCLPYRREIQS